MKIKIDLNSKHKSYRTNERSSKQNMYGRFNIETYSDECTKQTKIQNPSSLFVLLFFNATAQM